MFSSILKNRILVALVNVSSTVTFQLNFHATLHARFLISMTGCNQWQWFKVLKWQNKCLQLIFALFPSSSYNKVKVIILCLSVVKQNTRVTRRIVLTLLTKVLYKFGCFKETVWSFLKFWIWQRCYFTELPWDNFACWLLFS